jgi:hypothetical protein
VYSAAPISNTLPDTLVCIARSCTASVWVLGATIYSLPLAAAQICLVLYSSFVHASLQYEGIPPSGDLESAGKRSNSPTDVPDDTETDIVAAAAALTRNTPTMVQPLNGNGLSFHLALASGSSSAEEKQRKQEAVIQAVANGTYD